MQMFISTHSNYSGWRKMVHANVHFNTLKL